MIVEESFESFNLKTLKLLLEINIQTSCVLDEYKKGGYVYPWMFFAGLKREDEGEDKRFIGWHGNGSVFDPQGKQIII